VKKSFLTFQNIDKPLLGMYIALVVFGWFNVFSTGFTERYDEFFNFGQIHGRQLLFVLSAIVLGVVVLMLDVKIFPAFAWLIYLGFVVLLLGVLAFGVEINNSQSWFRFGSFAFQPSEFSKYATALALAALLGKIKSKTFSTTTAAAFAIIGIPMALILLQNDMGTALVFSSLVIVLWREGLLSGKLILAGIVAIFLFVLTLIINQYIIIGTLAAATLGWTVFRRNYRREWVFILGIFAALSIYVLSVDYAYHDLLQPHQKARIEVLINDEVDLKGVGYNLHQSKIAIGSGGFLGKGFLQGTQTKFQFVPEQSTDFIFSTVGEEWGFLGSALLIAVYLALMSRIVTLAERHRSAFGRIYGYAIASFLFFHFTINIGMTMGLMPVIGIPLPFLSYGGSSIWAFSLMIFTFLKIDSKRLDLL